MKGWLPDWRRKEGVKGKREESKALISGSRNLNDIGSTTEKDMGRGGRSRGPVTVSVGCLWAFQESCPGLKGSTGRMDLGIPLVFLSCSLEQPLCLLRKQRAGQTAGRRVDWGGAGCCNALSPGTGRTWAT